MTDVTGLFSLTKTPQALPGKCGGCGRATDDLGFIDTGLQFDYYGALLYCSECVLTMASKFGYINVEIADRLNARIAELEIETITQRKALLGLEEALDGLQSARAALSGLTNDDDSNASNVPKIEDIPSDEEKPNRDYVAKGTESQSAEGNSETDGPIGEQESVGVSSNSGYVDLDSLDF